MLIMPDARFNHTENSPENDNEFGHFLDPTDIADSNIGRDVIYQTRNDNNNISIGIENRTSVKDKNLIMIEIGKMIEKSQSEMIQVMKTCFKDVLEGQKRINEKIDALSQRIDKIEQMIASSKSHRILQLSRSAEDSEKSKNLIRKHLQSHIAFSTCSEEQLNNLVKAFKYEFFEANSIVFNENDEANRFFIIEEGVLDVFQKQEHVNVLKEPSSFGEIALLHGLEFQKHTMTVRSRSDCKLWSIQSQHFQPITNTRAVKGKESKVDFLRKIKISGVTMNNLLDPSKVEEIAKTCLKRTFRQGEVIAREGEASNAFYMIEEGTVNCYKKSHGAKPLETMTIGDSFGTEKIMDVTCIAASTVSCLHLMRKDFEPYFVTTEIADETATPKNAVNLINATFDDFEVLKPLGLGNFSSVKLVRLKNSYYSKHNISTKDTKQDTLFALKCFIKSEDGGYNIKQMMEDEKQITSEMESPFIVRYFGEIKHEDKTYLILEALLGGDLYKLLRKQNRFQEDWVRFYAASVLSAFTEIHAKHVAYRDLKPENLILTNQGYIKIIDFGLAKRVQNGKTYTCCGTLDYLSPEIILKTGHDMAVDYWALGILIYEMAYGTCPFIADDQIKTCQRILSGKLHIPAHFSSNLSNIVQAFLQKDPNKRLGKDKEKTPVKTHLWFEGFSWSSLYRKKLKAPFKPDCGIEHQSLKISAPSNVASIVGQVGQQRDIIAKLGNVDDLHKQNSKERLDQSKRSLVGKARNLKASMFGGYY